MPETKICICPDCGHDMEVSQNGAAVCICGHIEYGKKEKDK